MIKILKSPTTEDWEMCKLLALNTAGVTPIKPVSLEWQKEMLTCRHSPIRFLTFVAELNIPYWVSTHLVRHKIGVEHFVTSQRNDRQSKYDRETAPQNQLVKHIMVFNAEALLQICSVRLCTKASICTQTVVFELCKAIEKTNPEFTEFMLPFCGQTKGYCKEKQPCNVRLAYIEG